ncbi:hypothetical protein [Phytobacter sp. RSE-02]|uniref:hypothetical protein n=1 Tax=Phytobacter sp. RSE-02 TaxID=3229229 RepID=UPI00339D613A
MNIDFQDKGAVATISITSSIFEYRRHTRIVDTVLFQTGIINSRTGFFRMKTVISGPSQRMWMAFTIALHEASR